MKADIKWLDDPETFRVNQLPAHSDHYFYKTMSEIDHQSSYVKSLNGTWKFNFAKSPQMRPKNFYLPDFDSSNFDDIKVPGHIELAGYAQVQYTNTWYPWEGKIYRRPPYTLNSDKLTPGIFSEAEDNSVGSYLKKFDLPQEFKNKRVIVSFQGVEEALYVWLNGNFVGYAEDSFTPSEFDLTPYLQDSNNVLAVQVYKRCTASYLEDQDMFRFSGIFRDVNLLALPAVHLEDLKIEPAVNSGFKSGKLDVSVKLSSEDLTNTKLHLAVTDADDQLLENQDIAGQYQTSFATMDFDSINLWSPDHPYLYNLLIQIYKDDQLVEVIPYQFGFRKVELRSDKVIYVNDKRLIINGVNRHEWDAKSGRVITKDDMVADIETMKQNNINADRTCHYPDQIPWYYLCDQNGIYLMAENNLESHGTWQKFGQVEPSFNVPGDNPHWLEVVLDRARTNYEMFKIILRSSSGL